MNPQYNRVLQSGEIAPRPSSAVFMVCMTMISDGCNLNLPQQHVLCDRRQRRADDAPSRTNTGNDNFDRYRPSNLDGHSMLTGGRWTSSYVLNFHRFAINEYIALESCHPRSFLLLNFSGVVLRVPRTSFNFLSIVAIS